MLRVVLFAQGREMGDSGVSDGWAFRMVQGISWMVYLDLGKLRWARISRSSWWAVLRWGCKFDNDLESFWV